MGSVIAGEMRERMTRAVEEVQGLLGGILGFLDEYERLRVFADTTQRESERLRQEVDHLRTETERYRNERKEIADSFEKVTSVVQSVIEERTTKGQSVLVIGVGNTLGVGQ